MLFGGRRNTASHGADGGQHVVEIDGAGLMAEIAGEQPPLLLDVRTPGEYQEGHIPGAVLIPVTELPARIAEVPRDRPVVCVCRSGHRSGNACRLLQAQGIAARNLRGGMMRWHGKVARGADR